MRDPLDSSPLAFRTGSGESPVRLLRGWLPQSDGYSRAVGFFASSVFTVAPESWLEFFERGQYRVVTSGKMGPRDIDALFEAVVDRHVVLRDNTFRDFSESDLRTPLGAVRFLAYLVASRKLIVKIAQPLQNVGMFHEKIGFFESGGQLKLSIAGSANETFSAYVKNFERIDAFSPNRPDRLRANNILSEFNRLWTNETAGVEVTTLAQAFRSGAIEAGQEPGGEANASETTRREGSLKELPEELLLPPPGLELRPHQEGAIKAWAGSGGRGMLAMATGSGKTLTALMLASRIFESQGGPFVVLIIVPYLHLGDQWCQEARAFELNPVFCGVDRDRWAPHLSAALDGVATERRSLLSIVTTSATLRSPDFQRSIDRVRCPSLVIGDEVHNYGSESTYESLPKNFTNRIGLSATPERHRDPDGDARLRKYFGDVVYTYDLKDALEDGVLTPYRYYPQVVALEDEEIDQYLELSEKIRSAGGWQGEGDREISDYLKLLLIQRARVIASAEQKIPVLRRLLQDYRHETHMLIYCGDGEVEGESDGVITRQIDAVVDMVGNDLGIRCASYTAKTPLQRRREITRQFDRGEVQALVAIRCLDEGVDVPATKKAFILASTTNPRQSVQRRGRVLRRSEGKTEAEIYDMVVTLPPDIYTEDHPGFEVARNLLRGELRRVAESNALARNPAKARQDLGNLRKHFNLLSEGI